MSGGTRHSSAVSPGGHHTLGDGQHSDNALLDYLHLSDIKFELYTVHACGSRCFRRKVIKGLNWQYS